MLSKHGSGCQGLPGSLVPWTRIEHHTTPTITIATTASRPTTRMVALKVVLEDRDQGQEGQEDRREYQPAVLRVVDAGQARYAGRLPTPVKPNEGPDSPATRPVRTDVMLRCGW